MRDIDDALINIEAHHMGRISNELIHVFKREFAPAGSGYSNVQLAYAVLIHFNMKAIDAISIDREARGEILNNLHKVMKKMYIIKDKEEDSEKELPQ